MIVRLKDGRYMAPVMFGSLEEGTMTRSILGVDLLSENRDLFGKPVTERFAVEDIDGFYGGSLFPSDQWDPSGDDYADYVKMARRLWEEDKRENETIQSESII